MCLQKGTVDIVMPDGRKARLELVFEGKKSGLTLDILMLELQVEM